MRPKAAVFCHNGLGDGVVTLVLPNNLHLNGWDVQVFQNTIGSMQNWFPHLPVSPYPGLEEISSILQTYHWFFVVQNDSSEFVNKLIEEGKRRFPEKMKVLYLYPSKHIVNEPYYADCLTNPELSVSENMRLLCEKVLHLPKTTPSNGLIPPEHLTYRKEAKRVVIHPTSGRESKNWPKASFLRLATYLQEQGFDPVFVPGTGNLEDWGPFPSQIFMTLDALTSFIYESGYLVGNDSGLGHLASAVGIPTLTFCRRKAVAKMWGPSFKKGIVLTPSSWIPNIRGCRLRDRHWKKFISVGMAKRAFERLLFLA